MKTRRFTIDRHRRGQYELTVVGKTGVVHGPYLADQRGRDGHFRNEGRYRRAIERAVDENGGSRRS